MPKWARILLKIATFAVFWIKFTIFQYPHKKAVSIAICPNLLTIKLAIELLFFFQL
jgi:hypothetical protein